MQRGYERSCNSLKVQVDEKSRDAITVRETQTLRISLGGFALGG